MEDGGAQTHRTEAHAHKTFRLGGADDRPLLQREKVANLEGEIVASLCRLLNLLCSQVVQFLRVRELVMLCIDSTCDHTRTVEHLLVEEMLDRLVEGQLILVIDELAAIVQLAY